MKILILGADGYLVANNYAFHKHGTQCFSCGQSLKRKITELGIEPLNLVNFFQKE